MDRYKQAFNKLHKPHNIVVTYVNILQELDSFFVCFLKRVLVETRGRHVNVNFKSKIFCFVFSSLECIINYIKLETEFPE